MAGPSDEQLLAEADRLREADARKRLPWWPFLYCVLPIVLALALIVFVNRPGNNDSQNKSTLVPDLGPSGRPLEKPASPGDGGEQASDGSKDSNNDGAAEDGKADGGNGPLDPLPQEPPNPVSDFEIEIAIRNIQSGVKNLNPRQVAMGQEWLRENVSRGPISERITAALESEQDARVRLALFAAYADDKAALDWALSVYRSKTAKFSGGDSTYSEGEPGELKKYYERLIGARPPTTEGIEASLAALKVEKPDWVLQLLVHRLGLLCIHWYGEGPTGEDRAPFKAILVEVHELLKRGNAAEDLRNRMFLNWAATFETASALFAEVNTPAMIQYLPSLVQAQGLEADVTGSGHHFLAIRGTADYQRELLQAVKTVLNSNDIGLKRRVIAGLGRCKFDALSGPTVVREIVESGLARLDANYPDYLALSGLLARTSDDYDRLRLAANDPKPEVARGAIKGLKDAPPGEAADVRLREILDEGANDGVKADAFSALIERNPRDKDKLVEEYLDPAKPPILRVAAVAHVPAKDLERLQDLALDQQLKVREAAIHRLGALKDKKLHNFLKRVSTHDRSAVLRQLAAKYAAELE